MDLESLEKNPNAPRKVRFQPKAPARRPPKAVVPKKEVIEDDETAEKKELLRRLQDGLAAGKPKFEKKSEPTRVSFGYGSAISGRQYNASYQDKARVSTIREDEEYKEPWNYYGYYPLTLPLRRPYSGNPEILDEEEMQQFSTFDERMTNSALELGLMEENPEPTMLFIQLPKTLPITKRAAPAPVQASASSSKPPSSASPAEKVCGLNELQAGIMGKMLVYKSGAVKLKLGDTLYDVTPGSDCIFAQDVVAINSQQQHCCTVGELNKRAILNPDVDSILESFADLG